MPNHTPPTTTPPPFSQLQADLCAQSCSRPPFLVRNLRYVKEDRAASRRHLWDLSWATSSLSATRHLLLRVRPTLCKLLRKSTQQLLHPAQALSPNVDPPYAPRRATMTISLVLDTDEGSWKFGSKKCHVFVWPEEHMTLGVVPVDAAVEICFDLSAVVGVLSSFPGWMGLMVEIRSEDPAAKPINGYPATLRGEVPLVRGGEAGWIVKNGHVDVALKFVSLKEAADVKGRRPKDERPVKHGSLRLALWGGVDHLTSMLEEGYKPRVYVRCQYRSSKLPQWEGLVRHDFMCPWCHRNCHRFRTLVTHLQVEHEQFGFAVEGVSGCTDGRVPMTLEFDVAGVVSEDTGKEGQKKMADFLTGKWCPTISDTEDAYANPEGRFKAIAVEKKKAAEEMEKRMANVTLRERAERKRDGGETDSDDDKDFVKSMRKDLLDVCKYCARPMPHGMVNRYDKTCFCGELCDVLYKQKMSETEGSVESGDMPSMLDTASIPRPKSFNYKESLGKLKLYHIISVCEAKEEHFDPDDPDSEDEVDHSWRVDLSMERIRALDDATPKEKLLWMMWNKFSHENYPIPSVYAERYTRYTLELFALEYGPLITQKRLRVQFVGFLRALHIHGMIDTVAITSIMLCLDGKKKRRQCATSGRPDSGNEHRGRGRPKSAQRQRRAKKRN